MNISTAKIWTNNSEGIVKLSPTSPYPNALHINPPQIIGGWGRTMVSFWNQTNLGWDNLYKVISSLLDLKQQQRAATRLPCVVALSGRDFTGDSIFQPILCRNQQPNLVGGWTTPCEKCAKVKLDSISLGFGVKIKNIWNLHPEFFSVSISRILPCPAWPSGHDMQFSRSSNRCHCWWFRNPLPNHVGSR